MVAKQSNTQKRSLKSQAFFELGIFFAGIILINMIAGFLFFRVDFTKEQRFTLSNASKKLVGNLQDVVYVKVYLDGDFPAGFKRLSNATKETLDDLRAYAGGNLEYEFINPTADPDLKVRDEILQQLLKKGLTPINVQVSDENGSRQQIVVPGAIVSYRGKEIAIPLLQSNTVASSADEVLNNSVMNLEFQLVSAIKKASSLQRPKIAFIYGHGELDTIQTADVIKSLRASYQVDFLYLPATAPKDLLDYKTLIIAKPQRAFNEGEKFNIDQYIMEGGRVLWLIENLMADMDSLGPDASLMTSTFNLNLEDQLFTYGARINNDLIQDVQCAPIPVVTGNVGSQTQSDLMPWLFYPIFIPNSLHPVVKNLDGVRSEFANTIDSIQVAGVTKTALLQSSKYTKVLNAPVRVSLNMLSIEPNPLQFNKSSMMAAIALEGKFNSLYRNRLLSQNDSAQFLTQSKATRMIVVSDGDIIKNYVSKKDSAAYPLGYDRFTKQTFANKNFILNAVDYLADDDNIIEARTKEVKLRTLDKGKIKKQKLNWQIFNILLPNLLIVIVGIVLFYSRKRKYTR